MSIVDFDVNAVDKMSFNYFCSGYMPYVDVTPPQIDLIYPSETGDSQVTLTGTIKDPGGIKKATVSYGNTELLLTLNDQFSINLPLDVGENLFSIDAVDDAGNHSSQGVSVTRKSIPGFEFVFDYYEAFPIANHLDITGTINTPEGHIIKSATVRMASGELPLQLVGNRFSVTVPLKIGFNEYTFVAVDQYDNKTVAVIQEGPSEGVVLVNVELAPNAIDDPVTKISGEVHSIWPMETLIATLEDEPLELIRVTDTISRFEKTIILSVGHNRLDVRVEAPNGESAFEQYDTWYEPDRITIYLSPNEAPVTTENETIVVSGHLHLPDGLIGVITGVVAASDKLPGIEIAANLTPNSANDSTFSVEVPLALGMNKLLIKAKILSPN